MGYTPRTTLASRSQKGAQACAQYGPQLDWWRQLPSTCAMQVQGSAKGQLHEAHVSMKESLSGLQCARARYSFFLGILPPYKLMPGAFHRILALKLPTKNAQGNTALKF